MTTAFHNPNKQAGDLKHTSGVERLFDNICWKPKGAELGAGS